MEEARSRVARGEELSTKEMVQVHQLVLGAARLDGGNHCFQGGGSWLVRRGEGEEEGRPELVGSNFFPGYGMVLRGPKDGEVWS